MKLTKHMFAKNDWEPELNSFIVDMRAVTGKTIDKISVKTINKNCARLYWMIKEQAALNDFMVSFYNATSDNEPNDFF